jgi:hypothetical protein
MRITIAFLALLVSSSTAFADGSESSGLGIGVESTLTGVSGPTIAYQAPNFHVEGLLGFHDDNNTTEIDIAGRFFWELHQTAASDFSIGGGLGLESVDNGNNTDTIIDLELGAKIRAFVASNVALNASLGIAVLAGDADFVGLGGQLTGGLGVTYFFF